jgi:O-succinylbenzoic acid--CoA ligase
MIIESCDDAWRAAVKAAPVRGRSPGDGSVVVFTSGSTGAASSVELSSRVLAASAHASANRLGWTTDDRWLCCLPLAHVGGLSIVTRCWQGARTIVLEPEGRFDPKRLASHLEQHHVTLLSLVPTQLRALLDDRGWTPPGGLRAVLVGGAASSDDLLVEASDRGVPIRPTYGLTEAASQVATWPPDTSWAPGHGVGPPLPGVEITIRDDERIAVRGAMVDPCEFPGGAALTDEDGWLVTGDRGRLDTRGWLHVEGRLDDVIVTGGENVDPRSVEAALERSPGVVAACVVGIPDPVWGEVVAALVETRDERALDGLERRLEGDLAPHARPRRIVCVEALPVTATGKPDRRAAVVILTR